MIENSIIKLYLFLIKLKNYEEALYYRIKSLIFYKFKNNNELKSAVKLYTRKITFNTAYKKYGNIPANYIEKYNIGYNLT